MSENPRYALISVIGSHAGEDITTIFARKRKEIEDTGFSYWLIKSFKARTSQIQELGKRAEAEGEQLACLFVESSQRNGARPTSHDTIASFVSPDGHTWEPLPRGIRVTGKLDGYSTALVLKEINFPGNAPTLDLWDYSEFPTGAPVKLQIGASTACCTDVASVGMKSRTRNVVAIGTLAPPYAIWVK